MPQPTLPPAAASERPSPAQVTLGILAGGAASRLGGLDKAWLQREGLPQVLRRRGELASAACRVLVSAHQDTERLREAGLDAVTDRRPDRAGPLAGLEALALACRTPWLLTAPVDLFELPEDAASRLLDAAHGPGAFAEDDRGPQPLVAIWRVDALREAAPRALDAGRHAVRALQAELGMAPVRFAGVRFGNLNTPDDLVAAGIAVD